MLSGNEALPLMLDSNMTKAVFQLHRNAAFAKQCNLYPSYKNIKPSKLLCYPSDMIFTDFTANITAKFVTTQHTDFLKFKMMLYV